MKVTKYEIKALENVLGCMRHYVLIAHVKDEYTEAEWDAIKRAIRRVEVLYRKMEDSFLNE